MSSKCKYSHPGTYGHECGKPAQWAQHDPKPEGEGTFWQGGYWRVRCDECRAWTGPDNAGMRRDGWVRYDPTVHRNSFLRNRWPAPAELVTVPA